MIAEWHKKAGEEGVDNPFSAFVFEYLAFIALLKTELHEGPLDRTSIQRLKQDRETREKYLKCIGNDRDLANCWENIKRELDSKPLSKNATSNGRFSETDLKWWNCSTLNLPTPNPRETEKRGVLKSISDWENMVEFWYSIRNNMFHGTKNPENERDQFLVERGYKTLNPLMDILVH